MGNEIFEHKCSFEGCIEIVQYDDSPWCKEHIPEGQPECLPGYSARRAYNEKLVSDVVTDEMEHQRKNIFDRGDQ